MKLYYENELTHHGIKGQKWGVRRYQNPDGTLTAKGKQKLKEYKTSELLKAKKYYDKVDAKYAKREKRTNDRIARAEQDLNLLGIERGKAALARVKAERKLNKKNAEREANAIKNLKLSDVSEERIVVGAKRTLSILSIAGSTVLMAGGSPIGLAYLPSARKTKTRMRLS